MIIKFNAARTPDGLSIEEGYFDDENKKELAEFFDGPDTIDNVTVINEVPDMNFRYDWKEFADPIKQLLIDVKDSDSAVSKLMIDSCDDKIDIFNKLFSAYLINRLGSRNGASYDVFYGNDGYHFRVVIPKDVVEKYYNKDSWSYGAGPMRFDLKKLNKEEFIKYILPAYYHEIGAWDREHIRSNKELIVELRENWIDTLRAGLA